jgi:hypothetical protein
MSTGSGQHDGKVRCSSSCFGRVQMGPSSLITLDSIVDGTSSPVSIVTDYIPLETNRLNHPTIPSSSPE